MTVELHLQPLPERRVTGRANEDSWASVTIPNPADVRHEPACRLCYPVSRTSYDQEEPSKSVMKVQTCETEGRVVILKQPAKSRIRSYVRRRSTLSFEQGIVARTPTALGIPNGMLLAQDNTTLARRTRGRRGMWN
jgi:hypothetical protein